MAVQDDIAAALAAIAGAKDALSSIAGQATGAIAQVTAAYNQRLSSLVGSYVVNQATGSDSNVGSSASPLRSIEAAIAKVPRGGLVEIAMQTDYTIEAPITIGDRRVLIYSVTGVQRSINFSVTQDMSVTPGSRVCNGFRLDGSSALSILNMRVIVPPIGAYAGLLDRLSAALFRQVSQYGLAAQSVCLLSCAIEIPAAPFGPIVQGDWPLTLAVIECSLPGAVTSLNGRLVGGYVNTSGVPANTVPSITTNLATI